METFLVGLVATAITTAVTTIISLIIKNSYSSKVNQETQKLEEEKRKNEEQRKEYERLLKEEQTRNNRQMILDEIDPLVEELNRVKSRIKTDEETLEAHLQSIKNYQNIDKKELNEKIDKLISKYDENFLKIRESYKFRFIQLCKSYLKDRYITTSEWEQLTTMYELYHGLGGNGQAEDYYNQVKKLEIIPDKT